LPARNSSERLGCGWIGWVEGVDHQFSGGDVKSCAERGDHVQEPELASAVHEVQRHEDLVSRAGVPLIRPGDAWVAAYFTGQLSQPGVPGGENLMIEAPQEVGAPFAEIDDPWPEPVRVQGHAQGADGRYEQAGLPALDTLPGKHFPQEDQAAAIAERVAAIAAA